MPFSEGKTDTQLRLSSSVSCILVCLVLSPARAFAQSPANSNASVRSDSPERATSIERGIDLAAKGQCEEALPVLRKQTPHVTVKELKYRALMATVRCAMKERDDRATADTLFDMKREFPEDPEVLYMTSQVFLEIAERASQDLTVVAPNSYQTRELQAETLESQEKWAEAVAIYKKILEENPKLRGIHFRLGRAALSQSELPTSTEDAKKEFAAELAIDPVNAAVEFWLGEIARRDGQWDEAILHFTAAAKIDANFTDPLLALGMALNSAGRSLEAITPLEQYVKVSADDPAGHYQLSLAYARTDRKEDAVREMAIHQRLVQKKDAAVSGKAVATPR